MSYKVLLRDVVDVKSREYRKLKRGNTGHRRCMLAYLRFDAAAVVPLLLDCVLRGCL